MNQQKQNTGRNQLPVFFTISTQLKTCSASRIIQANIMQNNSILDHLKPMAQRSFNNLSFSPEQSKHSVCPKD